MKERQYRILGIFAVLALVLINYQNCASSKNADATQGATLGAEDGNMGVINPIVTGGIQFTQSKTTVSASDQNLNVVGLCSVEQSGAQISWSLQDANGSELFKGKALCDKGSFAVAFAGVQGLACGSALQLKAAFGAKAKTQTEIFKNCN